MTTKRPPRPANPAYAAMLVEATKRRQQALALKKEGKTNAEIGVALGVSGERARQMVAQALKDVPAAPATPA